MDGPSKSGIHKGHRERVKQEFLKGGLEPFSDVRALELLLFYALPQGDVNPLAHRLLHEFGTLAGVLDASHQELTAIPGVGDHVAILLKLVPAMSAKYLASRTNEDFVFKKTEDLWDLFAPYFFGARNEMTYLACFDNACKLLGVRKISEGGPNATDIGVRQLVTAALTFNASMVILAHNHPSGDTSPSQEDISSTNYLRKIFDGLSIHIYDHVIMTDDKMLSMRKAGLFLPIGY